MSSRTQPVTATDPRKPDAPVTGVSMAPNGAWVEGPAWVTVTTWPAMITARCRVAPVLFGSAVIVTVPFPVPPYVSMESHGGSGGSQRTTSVADHWQSVEMWIDTPATGDCGNDA